MRKSLLVSVVLSAGLALGGCLSSDLSPEQKAMITALETRIEALAGSNALAVEKYQAGTLTAAEFKETIDKNLVEVKALRDEAKELKASGVSAAEALAYGATGGVLGRTLLHGAARALPMIPAGPFQPFLGLLGSLLTMALQSKSAEGKQKA